MINRLEISEARSQWQPPPDWVAFLVEFGYLWQCQSLDSRMIAVVSMPSDSAGAGLVTLGAMRKCLEIEGANDISSHYEKLRNLARIQSKDVELRHISRTGRFVFDGFNSDGNPWVTKLDNKNPYRMNISMASATQWRVHTEAPVVLRDGEKIPNERLYAHLVNHDAPIKSSNLSMSYSKVCLAGQGAGKAPTRESIAKIRLRYEDMVADLSQLLTVQSWLPGTVSRTLFFNSRTEQFDRNTGKPHLVIADGDLSFLKVVDSPKFEDSNVIGVVHRTLDRDRLETIGTKLESLRQWYDQTVVAELPKPPRGIAAQILKRR